ncbi:P-loop containing nucleoside triphosphate hydrolase protein [Lyophyllum atratum]|nr:P-loop containing nucleoside triphosphate hydrolase protein [Lyophyllum atratum]
MAKAKSGRKGNKEKIEDIFLEDPKETDRVIVLMGPTGAGKSTFVNKLLDDTVASVGDDLESHTKNVQPFIFGHRTGRVIVIDTPGFDSTYMDDQEILSRIADWLARSHAAKMKLAGVIYFHRINDNRMARTARENLDVFGVLCGQKASKKIILTTTMWNKVSKEEGERSEAQMREEFWNEMLALGSRMFRLQDVDYSAPEIVEFILGTDILDVEPLHIQRQMVDDCTEFKDTDAALLLSSRHRDTSKVRDRFLSLLNFLHLAS